MDTANTPPSKHVLYGRILIGFAAVGVIVCLFAIGRATGGNHPMDSDTRFNTVPSPTANQPAAQVAAPARIQFSQDPNNSYPTYDLSAIDDLLHSRNPPAFGAKFRIQGKIAVDPRAKNHLSFVYKRKPFLYDWFHISLSDADLDSLRENDAVEVLCEYYDQGDASDPHGRYFGNQYIFIGEEMHKSQ